jgi:hypothetical protein
MHPEPPFAKADLRHSESGSTLEGCHCSFAGDSGEAVLEASEQAGGNLGAFEVRSPRSVRKQEASLGEDHL